jgi:hypothetical protein
MSETVLKIIPKDPEFVPTIDAIEKTEKYIKSLSKSYCDIKIIHTEEVRFIDQGSNFEGISCPICTSEIRIEWWSEAMAEAAEAQFSLLQITVPCCNSNTSLNSLDYNWNAGFARFSIEFHNLLKVNTEHLIGELEGKLCCSLRKVVANY